MLNIEIIYFGSIDNNWQKLKEHYQKLLKSHVVLNFRQFKAQSFDKSRQEKTIKMESEKLEKYLNKSQLEKIFLLSQDGNLYNSLSFAKLLNSYDSQKIGLVIGGSLGFNQHLKSKYQLISLSPLTFPHQMSQIILLEQIYRSISIIKNKSYHY